MCVCVYMWVSRFCTCERVRQGKGMCGGTTRAAARPVCVCVFAERVRAHRRRVDVVSRAAPPEKAISHILHTRSRFLHTSRRRDVSGAVNTRPVYAPGQIVPCGLITPSRRCACVCVCLLVIMSARKRARVLQNGHEAMRMGMFT